MTIKTKTKSYLKPVPFKIYADFEYILESVKSYKRVYSKKYQDRIPYCFHFRYCLNQPFSNV